MGRDIRRIVTGHDENGKAIVIADGTTPNVFTPEHRPACRSTISGGSTNRRPT